MELWVALSLMLVLEGLLPALSPQWFRQTMIHLAQMDDRTLRFSGLGSMILGAVILYLLKN